jgi:hypothetical protein
MRPFPAFVSLLALGAASTAPAQVPPGGQASDSPIRWEKTVPVIRSGPWTGKRLADGQPDVEGHWSNTIANHNSWTDPQGGSPGEARRTPLGPRNERAPSRVSDPADGEVPYQAWARAKQQDFAAHFSNPTANEYIEPLARCAPAGVPKSFTWHGYEIRQYPGVVLFLFNSGTRVIYLDGRPHLPEKLKLWNADSRGHWEGNTLVVDVTNNNSKALFGRHGDFASENVHITERFVFDKDGQRYNYVATFEDPTVYTRPWTATIPALRRGGVDDAPNGWHWEGQLANTPDSRKLTERDERLCVENNGPFGGVSVFPAKK